MFEQKYCSTPKMFEQSLPLHQKFGTKVLFCIQHVWTKVLLPPKLFEQKSWFAPQMFEQMARTSMILYHSTLLTQQGMARLWIAVFLPRPQCLNKSLALHPKCLKKSCLWTQHVGTKVFLCILNFWINYLKYWNESLALQHKQGSNKCCASNP